MIKGLTTRRSYKSFGVKGLSSSLIKNLSSITGTLHDDLCTFMIISCSDHLRMRNVSDKNCTEILDTILCFNNFFPKVCPFMGCVEIQYIVQPDRPQMAL
jgi:hypothetical protein